MIRLPRRSVTRFFIPLIDVLTLLFCIFLLMPLVKSSSDPAEAGPVPGEPERRPVPEVEERRPLDELALERQLLERLRDELQELRRQKIEALQQRLAIRVLEIDADTGKLYFQDPDGRVELRSQAEAQALIDRHRRAVSGRELYYLFLFPRRLTGYPEQRQVEQYQRWFASVAHGFDNPRGGR